MRRTATTYCTACRRCSRPKCKWVRRWPRTAFSVLKNAWQCKKTLRRVHPEVPPMKVRLVSDAGC